MHRSGRYACPERGCRQASGAPGAAPSRSAATAAGARLRTDDDQPLACPGEVAGHGRGGGAIATGAVKILWNSVGGGITLLPVGAPVARIDAAGWLCHSTSRTLS